MITTYIENHNVCIQKLSTDGVSVHWQEAADVILDTVSHQKTIFIAGNGGSAADAQHFAAELVGRFEKERRGYPAVALTTDTSALTAIGNDYGFDKIFSRQLDTLSISGDCFIGITTSGNSQNILEAFKIAKEKGLKTILLSGRDGGVVKDLADIALVVPSDTTSHIQEVHQIFYHAWCASIDEKLTS